MSRRISWQTLRGLWSGAVPDAELRAKVAAAEDAADAAAAQEDSIDRKVDVYVTVMKAQGLTVKDPAALRRRLQAGGRSEDTGGL